MGEHVTTEQRPAAEHVPATAAADAPLTGTAGIVVPTHNDGANIGSLLARLLEEPDVGQIVTERSEAPAYADLAGSLQDQLDRAATNAFSRSFLAAALLGLVALVPIFLDRRDVSL